MRSLFSGFEPKKEKVFPFYRIKVSKSFNITYRNNNFRFYHRKKEEETAKGEKTNKKISKKKNI